ncbi:MAG: phosphate acetyltransferase [Treponemataceae bacterium]
MSFSNKMKAKAKSLGNSLVLPEGDELRVVKATRIILDEGIAKKVYLLGEKSKIEARAKEAGVNLDGADLLDPSESEWLETFSNAYYEKRKAKGMTPEQAKKDMLKTVNFAAMMLSQEKVDAMVAGATYTTADVLRAGLRIVGTKAGVKTASSCFLMVTPAKEYGEDGVFVFADCSVVPFPTSEQLADISFQAAESFKTFTEAEPVVAILSFSTKGSGGDKDENVLRVREATKLVLERKPNFTFDGELQADAAIVPSVIKTKAPDSPVKGLANTLIFPDLGSANIGYKLVQRLAKAEAYGPFLQGFAKPLSDLSRGCSVEDIVTTSAVTLVQAGKKATVNKL